MSMESLTRALAVQGVTPGEKLVLLVLANRADKNGQAWPSIDNIAQQSCMSRSGVKKALRGLVDRELLTKDSRRNRSNVYRLTLNNDSTCRALSDLPEKTSGGHSETEGGHVVTVKGSLGNPQTVTQYPQNPKETSRTIIEPKDGEQNLNTEAWQEYLTHREEMKFRNLTPRGEEKIKQKLCQYTKTEQATAIDLTIANGWQGVFPERGKRDARCSAGSDSFYDNVRRNIGFVDSPYG